MPIKQYGRSNEVKSYKQALDLLGNRDSRKLANNTYLQKRNGNAIAVKYHATDVVTYKRDGAIILNSDGWRTVTTKERINAFSPVSLYQDKAVWFVGVGDRNEANNYMSPKTFLYEDGMTIKGEKVKGASEFTKEKLSKELKEKRKISRYAKAYIEAFYCGQVPAPSSGDCWFCAMQTEDGRTLGETTKDKNHIQNHIAEGYFVPSLLARAMQVMPHSPAMEMELGAFWSGNLNARPWGGFVRSQLLKLLRRYLYRQLGFAG